MVETCSWRYARSGSSMLNCSNHSIFAGHRHQQGILVSPQIFLATVYRLVQIISSDVQITLCLETIGQGSEEQHRLFTRVHTPSLHHRRLHQTRLKRSATSRLTVEEGKTSSQNDVLGEGEDRNKVLHVSLYLQRHICSASIFTVHWPDSLQGIQIRLTMGPNFAIIRSQH